MANASGEIRKSRRGTVWKFRDFSITQILREINFGDSRKAKSAIFTHFEPLDFDFCEFLHFWTADIYQINKIQSLNIAKKKFWKF